MLLRNPAGPTTPMAVFGPDLAAGGWCGSLYKDKDNGVDVFSPFLETTCTGWYEEVNTWDHQLHFPLTQFNMAGAVRQPFDEAAFERYLLEHVPEIQTPIQLKQV